MALSSDLSRYPEKFFDIANGIEKLKRFEITCESEKIARNLRLQFYGFKKAAIANGMSSQWPNLAGSVVVIRENRIVFSTADESDSGRNLRNALAGIEIEIAGAGAGSIPETEENPPETQEDILRRMGYIK